MLDIEKILEGFDLTTQPGNNMGDPLAKRSNTSSVQEEIDNLFFENKTDKDKLLSVSEEQMKELDKTLEFFKDEDSFSELTDIIKNVL